MTVRGEVVDVAARRTCCRDHGWVGSLVLVRHDGDWLRGVVLFEYADEGRARCMVRYVLPSGLVVRRLHWRDELGTRTVVLEMPLVEAPAAERVTAADVPRQYTPGSAAPPAPESARRARPRRPSS